jgi:hypothetical protein
MKAASDVEQLKCVPGSEHECPEGFSATIPENCVPMIGKNGNWECPKDYHSVEVDETAQCYPNSETCPRGATLIPHGEYDRCAEMVVGIIPMIERAIIFIQLLILKSLRKSQMRITLELSFSG